MASPIQKILQEASFAYMSKAGVVVRLAISYIVEDHMNTEEAVDKSLQESQMDLFWETAVEAAIAKAFAKRRHTDDSLAPGTAGRLGPIRNEPIRKTTWRTERNATGYYIDNTAATKIREPCDAGGQSII